MEINTINGYAVKGLITSYDYIFLCLSLGIRQVLYIYKDQTKSFDPNTLYRIYIFYFERERERESE